MFDETRDLVWSATHYVWGAVRAVKMYGGGAGAAPAWSDGGSINSGGTNGAAPAWQGKQGASLVPACERAQAEGAVRELICPFRFPSQYEDVETGLNYNRHRYYDALTGQYCSPDPIGLAGGDRPQGYVGRPTISMDVFGLSTILKDPNPGHFTSRIDPQTGGPMAIDTSTFKSGKITGDGGIRNSKAFWKSWMKKYPDTLSKENKDLIKVDNLSPKVDDHWVKHFPEHHRQKSDTLIHHHINQGPLAMPLPDSIHRHQPGRGIWHPDL